MPKPNGTTAARVALPDFTRRKSFTPNEVAARWGCDPQLVYRRLRRGHMHGFKVGGLWRIPLDEIERVENISPVVNESGQPVDDVEARIAALVTAAPPLTDEQRIKISALLLTGNGGAP